MYSDSLAVKNEKKLIFSSDQVDIAERFRDDLERVAKYSSQAFMYNQGGPVQHWADV